MPSRWRRFFSHLARGGTLRGRPLRAKRRAGPEDPARTPGQAQASPRHDPGHRPNNRRRNVRVIRDLHRA